jgi:hypothetical protein
MIVKRFHLDVSGVANSPRRISYAKKTKDNTVLGEITKKVKLGQICLPGILEEQNLKHHIPKYT